MNEPINKKDYPLTFWCEDFEVGVCCDPFTIGGWCHASPLFATMRRRMITVYPQSIFSKPEHAKMPDLSLGLKAEVCCGRYEAVSQLPREWWVRKYGEKNGYREEHIAILLNALPENYFRLSGEIASIYYVEKHGSSRSSSSNNSSRRVLPANRGGYRVSVSTGNCSSCGSEVKKNADVCDNCGAPQ